MRRPDMTTTINGSAFPASVADLVPLARTLRTELGPEFSQNRLMTELKIGKPKARAVLDALEAEDRPDLDPVNVDRAPGQPAEPEPVPQITEVVDPGPAHTRISRPWWLIGLVAPAFVAIWSGWVGLGSLAGFGVVHPLPGIADEFSLNTAITLPIGMETYAAYALRVWLTPGLRTQVRKFAGWSSLGALVIGALGQIAFHVMTAAGITKAPWQVTTLVACLPVAVLGMGAALAHMLRSNGETL